MGSIPNVLGSSTRHIPTLEFAKSLYRVLPIGKSRHDGTHGTVGLAISGGVDSMALAVLCSKLQSSDQLKVDKSSHELQYLRDISFKAFIVDHQVRSGSYKEAKAVSKVLEERGITAEILKIDWPKDHSSHSSNFESLARKYRFRLLGKACHERGINSLLLAHHEDDQVETIMMRLIAGHRRAGLVGIKEQGGIPECYGMHGIYESGGLDDVKSAQSLWETPSPSKQLEIETGGIKIYRPMLGFGKSRLIATCKHEGMEWFEDHTNKDPTLTQRNAIRHMFANHSMSAALSKPALLDLSQRTKDLFLQEDNVVSSLLSKNVIKNFNSCVGTVLVQFPTKVDIIATSGNTKVDLKRIAATLLRRVLFLVSPLEHIELTSLDGAVTQLFPNLSGVEEHTLLPKPLTVASVYLQPIAKQTPRREKHSTLPDKLAKQGQQTTWLLSRQPYNNSSDLPNVLFHRTDPNTWTPWHLYDGRFWIRVKNLEAHLPVSIRPFQPSDLKQFKLSLDKKDRPLLDKCLRESAGGNIRWTLPALVIHETSKGQVLALPTLGFHGRGAGDLVKWEVRYKKVEVPLH